MESDVCRTMLCSEILEFHLQSGAGREREFSANLEEIWPTGALFQSDARTPLIGVDLVHGRRSRVPRQGYRPEIAQRTRTLFPSSVR